MTEMSHLCYLRKPRISVSYTTDQLPFNWLPSALEFSDTIEMPRDYMSNWTMQNCTTTFKTGLLNFEGFMYLKGICYFCKFEHHFQEW